MVRIYKTRKRRRKKRNTRKNNVFRKKRHTKNKKKKRNNRKRRSKKGGEVRRHDPVLGRTVRVADKWVGGMYGDDFKIPYFLNWPLGGGRQWGSTSVAAIFLDRVANGGRVHLYGTALPWQGRNPPVGDIRDQAVFPPAGGLGDNSRIYRQMAYFVYNKGVKKWISHQACSSDAAFPDHFYHDPDSPGCQGNPTGGPVSIANLIPGVPRPYGTAAARTNAARVEDNTWLNVRRRYPVPAFALAAYGPGIRTDPNWQPVQNMFIRDMRVGRVPVWGMINQMGGFWDHRQSTACHCFAGWGRTGCTLYYHIWRNWYSFPRPGGNDLIRSRLGVIGLGFANSREMYDALRTLANRSLILDDMNIDMGSVQPGGVGFPNLPALINNARPIDTHAGSPGPPAGRVNGDWEGGAMVGGTMMGAPGRTSDLVHEIFALHGRGGNMCADIFISRINIMIMHIWVYLYLTDYPGSAAVVDRKPLGHFNGFYGWDQVILYRLPSAPRGPGVAGPTPGWPAGSARDRTSPEYIFGHGSWMAVHMGAVCLRAGYAPGGYGGHITKPIPPPLAAYPPPSAAAFAALFGIHF